MYALTFICTCSWTNLFRFHNNEPFQTSTLTTLSSRCKCDANKTAAVMFLCACLLLILLRTRRPFFTCLSLSECFCTRFLWSSCCVFLTALSWLLLQVAEEQWDPSVDGFCFLTILFPRETVSNVHVALHVLTMATLSCLLIMYQWKHSIFTSFKDTCGFWWDTHPDYLPFVQFLSY